MKVTDYSNIDLYIINSAFPLVSAIANSKASSRFTIAIVVDRKIQASMSNIVEKSFSKTIWLDSKGILRTASTLAFIYMLGLLGRIDRLFVGNISTSYLPVLYNTVRSRRKTILEDGLSTYAFAQQGPRYYNQTVHIWKKLATADLISLSERKKHNLLSMLAIESKYLQITSLDLSQLVNRDTPQLVEELLIVGAPLVETRSLGQSQYLSAIEVGIRRHKEMFAVMKTKYQPHPRESIENIRVISERFGIEVLENGKWSVPLELAYLDSQNFSAYLFSVTPSTSLVSLKLLNRSIKISTMNHNCLSGLVKRVYDECSLTIGHQMVTGDMDIISH